MRLLTSTCLTVLVAVFAIPFAAVPQEHTHTPHEHPATGRQPANILSAEQAGILLMEGRVELEQPDRTLDMMGLKDGDLVVDLGCGNGFYTLRVAERIQPHGHVFAVDIQQGMLDQLKQRMDDAGVTNVYPILGATDDPYLPPGKADWILLVDVYHEFQDPQPMLAKIKKALAPGGRVALLEYRAEQDPSTIPFPIPRSHKMSVEEVMAEWVPAGFELIVRHDFLPAQHLFVFKDAADTTPWHENAAVIPMAIGEVPNLSSFGGHVYFAGQPAAEDLKRFAERGVKTVINLRTQQEMDALGFDESQIVHEQGMEYINIPVTGEGIDEAGLEALAQSLENAGSAPVLLHCGTANRVGYVWSLYRARQHGVSPDDAIAEGRAAGLRAPALESNLRERIETAPAAP